MRLGLVAIGGAGARLSEAIIERERDTGLHLSGGQALAIDTDRTALAELGAIDSDRRVPIGETHPEVIGTGVDGDAELGVTVAREDRPEIHRAFDILPIELLDGLLVLGGVAGGTGGGVGAAVLEQCTELFELPIYAVAVLPREAEGEEAALRAARALQSYVRLADNVIVLDNETWLGEAGAEPAYDAVNRELADRLVEVLAAGDPAVGVGETRVDRSDIMRTLATGGVSTIGRASETVIPGWRRYFTWLPGVPITPKDGTNRAMLVKQLVQEAAHSQLTLPCEIGSTERALIVVSGPPAALSRKGFETAKLWLESELGTVEVVAGDEPRRTTPDISAVVLLSNVTTVPRIEALKAQALRAKRAA